MFQADAAMPCLLEAGSIKSYSNVASSSKQSFRVLFATFPDNTWTRIMASSRESRSAASEHTHVAHQQPVKMELDEVVQSECGVQNTELKSESVKSERTDVKVKSERIDVKSELSERIDVKSELVKLSARM